MRAKNSCLLQPCNPRRIHPMLCGETRESEDKTSVIGWEDWVARLGVSSHVT